MLLLGAAIIVFFQVTEVHQPVVDPAIEIVPTRVTPDVVNHSVVAAINCVITHPTIQVVSTSVAVQGIIAIATWTRAALEELMLKPSP